jgi:hypothetical protein
MIQWTTSPPLARPRELLIHAAVLTNGVQDVYDAVDYLASLGKTKTAADS